MRKETDSEGRKPSEETGDGPDRLTVLFYLTCACGARGILIPDSTRGYVEDPSLLKRLSLLMPRDAKPR